MPPLVKEGAAYLPSGADGQLHFGECNRCAIVMLSGLRGGFADSFGYDMAVVEELAELPADKRGGEPIEEWSAGKPEFDGILEPAALPIGEETVLVAPVGEGSGLLLVDEEAVLFINRMDRMPAAANGAQQRNREDALRAGVDTGDGLDDSNISPGGRKAGKSIRGFVEGKHFFHGSLYI